MVHPTLVRPELSQFGSVVGSVAIPTVTLRVTVLEV
jgi:hypothetical protein